MRTLERLSADGRIVPGRKRGKTRPLVVFATEDVEKLKSELEAQGKGQVFRRLNTEKPRDAIGFRLDPMYVSMLEEQGVTRGMSAGEFARHLVIQGLEQQNHKETLTELASLRQGLAEMFFLVLTQKMGASEIEAEEVVKSILKVSGA